MYPDFNSSFHLLGYIREEDDLNAIPGMKRSREFWAQLQGNFRSLHVTAWLLSSDNLGLFYLRATFTYCVGRLVQLHAMWYKKCAGKQILVVEVQGAVAVLLARCSGERDRLARLTLTSVLSHSSENTSGQKGRGLGDWLLFPICSGKCSVARSWSQCRLLPRPYSRSDVEPCMNFSPTDAWASLPKVLVAEFGA